MSELVAQTQASARKSGSTGIKLNQPKNRTDKIIKGFREDYGLNQNMIVRLTGYSPRSIISWSQGKKAQKPAAMKFTELNRLFEALADLTQNREEVAAWLETPNDAFEGSTPLQVIERGESDRLWSMIYYLRSGQPI